MPAVRKRQQKGDWVVAGGRPSEAGHCTRCGRGLQLGSHLDLTVAVAALKAFVKVHSSCKDIGYKEPIAKTPKEWAMSRDVGVSSGTIYAALTGKAAPYGGGRHYDVPHDADDFGRCYRLLKLFPFCQDISKVVALCPKWKPFVTAWDELTAFFEAQQYESLNQRIRDLEGEPCQQ